MLVVRVPKKTYFSDSQACCCAKFAPFISDKNYYIKVQYTPGTAIYTPKYENKHVQLLKWDKRKKDGWENLAKLFSVFASKKLANISNHIQGVNCRGICSAK